MENVMAFPNFSLGIEVTEKKKTMIALVLIMAVTLMFVACTVDEVLADISMLIQTAGAIGASIALVSPADGIIVANLANIATVGLQAIQTAYDTYKASGAVTDLQKVKAAILAIQTNLPQELAAAHIVDPEAVRMATAWVGLITTTLTVILNLLPNIQVGAVAGQQTKVKLTGKAPSAKSIKARWAAEVCNNKPACAAMVQ